FRRPVGWRTRAPAGARACPHLSGHRPMPNRAPISRKNVTPAGGRVDGPPVGGYLFSRPPPSVRARPPDPPREHPRPRPRLRRPTPLGPRRLGRHRLGPARRLPRLPAPGGRRAAGPRAAGQGQPVRPDPRDPPRGLPRLRRLPRLLRGRVARLASPTAAAQ